MLKKIISFFVLILIQPLLFGAGSSPEASLADGVKHKINVHGTLTLHTNPSSAIPVEHITFNGQLERIFMYIKPEATNAEGEPNYERKAPEKTQDTLYELKINPTQAYDKVDLVSKDPAGNIRIETIEITTPEPNALWVYKKGARKYEYVEVIVTSNISNKKRHYLVERTKEIKSDAKEAAGELSGGAKISAVKTLKIEGFKVEEPNNDKQNMTKKIKSAKLNRPKNRSMKIIKSS